MMTRKKAQSKVSNHVEVHNTLMQRCVLVATYKKNPDQLKWIGKRHLYNYPLSAEEVKSDHGEWEKVCPVL